MLCYLWIHKKHRQPYLGIVAGNKRFTDKENSIDFESNTCVLSRLKVESFFYLEPDYCPKIFLVRNRNYFFMHLVNTLSIK